MNGIKLKKLIHFSEPTWTLNAFIYAKKLTQQTVFKYKQNCNRYNNI